MSESGSGLRRRRRRVRTTREQENDDKVKEETTIPNAATASLSASSDGSTVSSISAEETTPIFWCSAIRNVALWRMLFFCIMLHEWGLASVLTPFGSLQLQLDLTQNQPGKDYWFGYNQFEWVQNLHVLLGSQKQIANLLHPAGYLLCFLAAFGKELHVPYWRIYTSLFTILYLIRFLAKATNFTNHNYLFPLLMILTIASGGGHVNGREGATSRRRRRALSSSSSCCEAATVAMWAQFAVVYGFASLWKLHGDWLAGRIVRGIFVSFEARGTSRGISWTALEQRVPFLFALLAWSGLLLDASMFVVLVSSRPRPASTHLFVTYALLFHVFTTITMGQVIGYSFPGTCVAGLLLFLPFQHQRRRQQKQDDCSKRPPPSSSSAEMVSYCSNDMNLMDWMRIYWENAVVKRKNAASHTTHDENGVDDQSKKHGSKSSSSVQQALPPRLWQQRAVLVWVAWQVLFPLRMIFVSGGDFPFNRLGYRYSWTMMLHGLDHGILRRHAPHQPNTVLLLSYLVPTCFFVHESSGRHEDVFMPRTVYLKGSEHPMQDSRTVPLHVVLNQRESAMLDVFPIHLLPRVASGFGKVIDAFVPDPCGQVGIPEQPRIGMLWTYFARLNQLGPYSRLVDPTVDLVDTAEAQHELGPLETVWNSLWDRRPAGHEFLLDGVGSLRSHAIRQERLLQHRHPGSNIRMVADRSACLQRRPLWLRPMGNPWMILPVQLPSGMKLAVRAAEMPTQKKNEKNQKAQDGPAPPQWKDFSLSRGQPGMIRTFQLEIGIAGPEIQTKCGDTTNEDVLFAFVYDEPSVGGASVEDTVHIY